MAMSDVLRAIFWTVVIVGLGFAYRACAQDSSATPLPDAPSAGVACYSTKIDEQGKIAYAQLPCPSSWRSLTPPLAPKKATFLTFRKSWQDPPLRTSRQVFNKKFILLHVGAAVAMVVACRNPRSGETWHSEAPVPIALVGMDYLMSRFFTEALAVEAPVYAMQHYARAATK